MTRAVSVRPSAVSVLRAGLATLGILILLPGSLRSQEGDAGDDPLARLSAQYAAARQRVIDEFEQERSRVEEGYLNALRKYERELQEQGALEALLLARRERENYEKTRTVGTSEDERLAELRGILAEALEPIESEKNTELGELTSTYIEALDKLKAEFTKAGDLEAALLAKDRIEAARNRVPVRATAAAPEAVAEADERLEPFPSISAPLVGGDPFEDPDAWPNEATVPAGDYRIDRLVELKRERGSELVLSAGSSFRGSGSDRRHWNVGNSLTVAREVTFDDFEFRGNLGSRLFFEACEFTDVTIGKGGGWFGGRFMSRWQFRECHVEGNFIDEWHSRLTGVQAWRTTFERVDFSPIFYHDEDTPAEFARQDWALFLECHFVKCTLPATVLSLMEECTFDDCRFIDDPEPVGFEAEIRRVLFVRDCTWAIRNPPRNLELVQRPLEEKR